MKTVALSILMATLALAQTPGLEKKLEFEVASIRPAVQDGSHDLDVDRGLYRTHNLTLKQLIAYAYDVDLSQIYGGPNWVDSDSYDVNARIPEEFTGQTGDTVPPMVQSLLADRFKLVIHREPRQISGYALVLAKTGSKMERAKEGQKGSNAHSNNTHLSAQNVTMEAFARRLSRNPDIGRVVVVRPD